MALALQNLNPKDQAMLLAAVLFSGNRAPRLMESISSTRLPQIQAPLQELLDQPEECRPMALKKRLSALKGEGKESLLYSAEPGWIVEAFKGESPRLWALILEDLPKATVGGVLKDLSRELRKELKRIKIRPLEEPIRSLVKRRAESRFPDFDMGLLNRDEVLKKLSGLRLSELTEVLRELGISEMATAFCRVQRSALRAILNRLKISDAKEIQKRIKHQAAPSTRDQREAQLHILSLELDKMEPEELIQEIGFGVLSRAFGREDKELATFFVYKLPPRQGYLLKRMVEQNASQHSPQQARKIRERVLDAYTRVRENA